MRISVAMAVYHGEAYLDAQLSSILSQLEPEDEIIVSDDCPGRAKRRRLSAALPEPRPARALCAGAGPRVDCQFWACDLPVRGRRHFSQRSG